MKKATSIIIPSDILEFILLTFNKNGKRHKRNGCNSFVPDLVNDINKFIDNNSTRLPLIKTKFHNGVSEDHIRRAFNLKGPNGATCELRNALAFYATRGKMNWNRLIETRFPYHATLLDKHDDCIEQHKHNITINELYQELMLIKKLLLEG